MTAELDQIIAEMRAGLEGATEGKWEWMIHDHSMASLGVGSDPGMGTPLVLSISPCRSCTERVKDGEWKWGRCSTPCEANAAHIARCSPDNIAAILNALSQATSRAETLQAVMEQLHGPLSIASLTARAEAAEAERDEAQLLSLENHNLAASNKARATKAEAERDAAVEELAETRSSIWKLLYLIIPNGELDAGNLAVVEAISNAPSSPCPGDSTRSVMKCVDANECGCSCGLALSFSRRARSAKEPT